MSEALASHEYSPGGLRAALDFLKRTWAELRPLRRVRVWKDRLEVFDVNNSAFEVRGIGYGDADIVPLLNSVNAVYDPQTLHDETTEPFKEFKTGRHRPWAEDRVM